MRSDETDNVGVNGTGGSESDESMRNVKRARNGKKYKRIVVASDSESESSNANVNSNPILTCVSNEYSFVQSSKTNAL